MPEWKPEIRARLAGLSLDAAREAGIIEEIAQHLDDRFEELRARGVSEDEARRQALEELSGEDLQAGELRKIEKLARLEPMVLGQTKGNMGEEFWGDLKFGARVLLKNPGFALAASLTLALGIGATTAIFSIVNGVLLKPLPFDQPGQLVQVWEATQTSEKNSVSPGAFLDWRDHNKVFESLSLCNETDANLTGQGDPERVHGLAVSASGLQVLRARAEIGRTFAPDEDQPGKDKVVILTDEFWRRRFGRATNILNGTIQIDGENHIVIGVLPRRFLWQETVSFVIPTAIAPSDANQRSAHWLSVIGRLKPGITLAQAQAEMKTLAVQLRPLYPAFAQNWSVTLVPMREQLTGDVQPMLLALAGAVSFVLLIACTNVGGLLLAKAARREGEMAIRVALGASRGRIVRQLLAENMLLSLSGAALGILLAYGCVAVLGSQSGVILPRAQEVRIDSTVLGFAVLMSVLVGTGFGLAPALKMSRPDLNEALKEGTRGSGARSLHRMRTVLVVTEVAISVVLLTGAGLLLKSFVHLMNVPTGINPQQAVTMTLSLPVKKYPSAEMRGNFVARLIERINSIPGVQAAGVAEMPPLATWGASTTFTVIGRPGQPEEGSPAGYNFCTPGYFRAVGDSLLRGRLFDETGRLGGAKAVVVSDAFARTYFPNEDPLGKRIHLDVFAGKVDEGWEIVGVVGDIRHALSGPFEPCIYRPQPFAWGGSWNLVIRSTDAPGVVAQAARKAVQELDPALPLAAVQTMEEVVSLSAGQARFTMLLFSGFAGAALLLAAIGLYALIAFSVAQRTREIGIRTALGATRGCVIRLILGQGFALGGIGVGLGSAAAFELTRVMGGLLFEVTPTDGTTFFGVAFVLLIVVLLACWLPARRASLVDPMVALRCE